MITRIILATLAVLLVAADRPTETTSDDRLTIRLLDGDRNVDVELRLSAGEMKSLLNDKDVPPFDSASRILWLAVVDTDGSVGPPVFARYRESATGDVLRLTPRYPLLPGVTYRAIARLADGTRLEKTHQVAAALPTAPPKVTAIFPSGDILPANCLKFYIHFSQPMREGRDIFERIQILDEAGEVVSDPWRRVELWSLDARRLTLWIHPGRIKQGVNLREEFGPVLLPEHQYRLVIRSSVQNAQSVALGTDFEKHFRTSVDDHDRPLPQDWSLTSPTPGTREPLIVTFNESLDRALLDRFLRVESGDRQLTGMITVKPGEQVWSFTPTAPWPAQKCHLTVNGGLEDLAGNTPQRVFDTDLQKQPLSPPRLSLPIEFKDRR